MKVPWNARMYFSALAVLILLSPVVRAADHPWQITSKDGKSALAFGFLLQGQAEWLTNPTADTTTQNLFLRRMRLIAGGQVNEKISFFIETDSPNLGKGQADGGHRRIVYCPRPFAQGPGACPPPNHLPDLPAAGRLVQRAVRKDPATGGGNAPRRAGNRTIRRL